MKKVKVGRYGETKGAEIGDGSGDFRKLLDLACYPNLVIDSHKRPVFC